MKSLILAFIALSGCTTVNSMLPKPPYREIAASCENGTSHAERMQCTCDGMESWYEKNPVSQARDGNRKVCLVWLGYAKREDSGELSQENARFLMKSDWGRICDSYSFKIGTTEFGNCMIQQQSIASSANSMEAARQSAVMESWAANLNASRLTTCNTFGPTTTCY